MVYKYSPYLHDFLTSPNIVRVIQYGKTRWAGLGAQMGKRRVLGKVSVKNTEGLRTLARPRGRRKDNIKWIFKKSAWKAMSGLIWLRIWTCSWLL